MVDELLRLLELLGVDKQTAFADDINFIFSDSDRNRLEQAANSALSAIVEWGEENGLQFNSAKTQLMRINTTAEFSIRMNGEELQFNPQVKCLG